VSSIITYDSTRVVVVTCEGDTLSQINMYSLNTQEELFSEKIEGTYIKVKEVEQNSTGSQFACVYIDDGKFRLRIFGRDSRTTEEIQATELKINELFGMDDFTMTNDDFSDPFITCCFTEDNRVFVNFFHSYNLKHYHFLYDINTGKVIGEKTP
jgi:hypothetical protein